MANKEHLAILMQGVEAWNEWREANKEILPDLTDVHLHSANLSDADLSAADLSGAQLILGDLSDVNLSGAKLNRASFSEAKLIRACLTDAKLIGADLSDAKLFRADLSRADLSDAKLSDADLSGANLSDANLSDAKLIRAYLSDAHLIRVDLSRANLSGAKLISADLNRAELNRANLSHADLSRATFDRARLMETVFGNTNLSDAKGLEECVFAGPCIVDHGTIERSVPLPGIFLRGCGLADWQIEASKLNTPGLTPSQITDIVYAIDRLRSTRPIQYYSCFISYSTQDDEFAQRLHADLQNNGVRCWFAPHDIAGGKKIHEQIEEAIRRHERLLLILSEHSIESDWVATEIANAREREATEGRQVLFPIRLVDYQRIKTWKCFDADRGKDSAKEIREYFIPDFTNWKDHDAYTLSFERLLKDLKAETASSEFE